jgi:tRNA A37 threonylcarbamoyladenosine modification protein TsaB
MPKSVDLVFITLSSPIIIGVYENKILIDSILTHEKSSEILPSLYMSLDEKYKIKKLFYANGPGSFMAIKIAYIFLKSISILNKIPLFATDAFYFNEKQPIKALGKLFFVKVSSEIKTQKLEIAPSNSFKLPDVLDYNEFSKATIPLYCIGAVGN